SDIWQKEELDSYYTEIREQIENATVGEQLQYGKFHLLIADYDALKLTATPNTLDGVPYLSVPAPAP
ncbi:MAG: hypothetical protein U0176_23490, partial [Bacteroidia bacterium]